MTTGDFFKHIDQFVDEVVNNPADFATEGPGPQAPAILSITKAIYDFGKKMLLIPKPNPRNPFPQMALQSLSQKDWTANKFGRKFSSLTNP